MAALNDHNFASGYMELCRQNRIRPLPMICVTLPHSLDFTTDRVKMDDWTPILNALSLDRSLRSISVRSKYQHRKYLDSATSESKARAVNKAPVVLTRYLLEWLSHSLAQCIRNSTVLTNLELEGIPLPTDCLAVLCLGLAGTKSLQHVSLQRCHIGDAGCEIVCRAIGDVKSIRTINLSHCDLTSASGSALASALSRQKLSLYHDAWKQSLRYREPKLESMPGLRRLTLNGNNKLGNEAVTGIIEAIRDSLWFKALDLQQCGLTDDISNEILQLLDQNQTLVVVDVRMNPGIRADTLNEINRKLERNELHSSSSKSEYRWLNLPQQKESSLAIKQRVSSAGNIRGKTTKSAEEIGSTTTKTTSKPMLTRPRSAIIRPVKRPPAPMVYRKPLLMPLPQVIRRIKTKPGLTSASMATLERRSRMPMKPIERVKTAPPQPTSTTPKVSLHLDLQSQLKSLADSTQNDFESTLPPIVREDRSRQINDDEDEDQEEEEEEDDDEQREDSTTISPEAERLRQVLRELLECQEERDKLTEDKRRLELLLAEERARREFAESKLYSARSNLADLEETLRQRELDSHGQLLISPKSMEELCLSFARLLELLEESSMRKSSDGYLDSEEEESQLELREDIKRRFALIIRKTKSENLKRASYFADEGRLLPRLELTARYGRSEGNIRTTTTIEPLHPSPSTIPRMIERHGGDSASNCALPQMQDNSHGDRARALFASLVSGGALLGIDRQRSR